MNPDDRSARQILGFLKTKKSIFWEWERRVRALALFHRAAKRVPAYKDFLKKHRVDPDKVKTLDDFAFVPPVSKADYLRAYPLEKLVWDGTLEKPIVFTSTSGSTGAPFYFPREHRLDWESSIVHEFFLNNSSKKRKGPILVIVGFGMGAWIGGLITYKAFEIANRRGANVCVITPGINKGEIFHALKNLSPQFSETILAGYPPFMKDIMDEAPAQGINMKRLNLRLLFAAESFSETFRSYLAKTVGINNVYRDTMNVYGTADIGTMAYETPTSILIRRLALGNKKIFEALFTDIHRTPTLAQYNSLFITFEAQGGNVLLTGDNTIPLVRYAIGDKGGILNFPQIVEELSLSSVHFGKEAKKAGIEDIVTELPFVYVYERSDLSTKLYGAIIYPEPIKEALQSSKLNKLVTGKFTMATRFDRKQNQFLEVNIELKPGVRAREDMKLISAKLIVERLLVRNAEYRNNYGSMPHKVMPRIKLWLYGHHRYFKGGGKQRWVEK
jgi:phenylacetate-CoA ligase